MDEGEEIDLEMVVDGIGGLERFLDTTYFDTLQEFEEMMKIPKEEWPKKFGMERAYQTLAGLLPASAEKTLEPLPENPEDQQVAYRQLLRQYWAFRAAWKRSTKRSG